MNPLLKKILYCLVAGLTVAALLLVLGNSGTLLWFPPVLVFSLVGITLLASLVFPFVWHYRESRKPIDSQRIYAILFGIIRYSVAFNIASFGWKKLFGLQFLVPPEVASQPMNRQVGEILTWYYFGYSEAFGTLIAITQIVGSYFLLFRRTFLLSSVALFALMLNIALVDIFYQLNAGATVQGVLLTVGLFFLLMTEYEKLRDVFFKPKAVLSSDLIKNSVLKNAMRLSAIVLSLLFVYYVVRLN